MPQLKNRVKKILSRHASTTDTLVVGASGGCDSQVLLWILGECGYTKVHCVHVDYHARKDSSLDVKAVQKLVSRYGFELHEFDTCWNEKGNFEAWAREFRYAQFKNIAAELGAKYILTAHHGNDLVESVLMQLGRGTTLHGITHFLDHAHGVLRPLIECTKDELLELAKKEQIPYVVDSTNTDTEYLRNYLRKEVVTPWMGRQEKVSEHVLAFVEHAHSISEYLTEVVQTAQWFQDLCAGKAVSQKLLSTLPAVELSHGVSLLYKKTHGNNFGMDAKYIRRIRTFLTEAASGKEQKIAAQIFLSVSQGKVKLCPKITKSMGQKKLLLGKKISWGPWSILCEQMSQKPRKAELEQGLYLCSDKPMSIAVRPWEPGDRFTPYGMKGSKKLSDYFIDEKIPLWEKHVMPVFVSGESIVALPKRPSRDYACDDTKHYFYRITCTPR